MRLKRVLFAAAMACALGIASPSCAQGPQFYTVSGVVKDRLSGEPIERALVDAQSDAVLTDSEGRFELRIAEGVTRLQVHRPGYVDSMRFGGPMVRVGENMTPLTLYLTPAASITGRVTVTNGGDAPSITFTAYRRRTISGHERWMQAGIATTNSEGVFTMFDMEAPAAYVLCSRAAEDQSGPRRARRTGTGYASVCYPAGPGDGTANMLNLGLGQRAEVEIPITQQPFYPVTFVEQNNPKGRGMSIQIYDQSGLATGSAVMHNQDGQTAEIDLPNGTYYAEAQAWGDSISYARVDFKVSDGPVSGLRLALQPLAPIAVEIHKEFTATAEPPDRAGIGSAEDMNGGVNLLLIPVDDIAGGGGGQPLRHTPGADSGHYEVMNLKPGRYWVQASYFLGGYISSIASGGVDLMREPLAVGVGSSAEPIHITVRNDFGEIDCTVNSVVAEPSTPDMQFYLMHSPVVFAIPDGPRGATPLQATFFGGRPVQISNLAPGTYHVIALDSFRDLNSVDPQELAKLIAQGKTVTVAPGGTVNVQLDLIKSGSEGLNP
jgi:hypothetical protein